MYYTSYCILQFLNLTEGFGGKFGVQSDRVDKVQYFFITAYLRKLTLFGGYIMNELFTRVLWVGITKKSWENMKVKLMELKVR